MDREEWQRRLEAAMQVVNETIESCYHFRGEDKRVGRLAEVVGTLVEFLQECNKPKTTCKMGDEE